MKQAVILKSYGAPLPFPTTERNEVAETPHTHQISPEPWALPACPLSCCQWRTTGPFAHLSPLLSCTMGDISPCSMEEQTAGKAACTIHINQLQPGRSFKVRATYLKTSDKWLSRQQESCFLVRKEEQGRFLPPCQTVRASPVLILKFTLKYVVRSAPMVMFPKKICTPMTFFNAYYLFCLLLKCSKDTSEYTFVLGISTS